MPKKASLYPKPRVKYHRGTWEIYWNWNGGRYSVYPGRQDQKDPDIEFDLRRVAHALALLSPVFPRHSMRLRASGDTFRVGLVSSWTNRVRTKMTIRNIPPSTSCLPNTKKTCFCTVLSLGLVPP